MKKINPISRLFNLAKEANPAQDEADLLGADQFGAEADFADLENTKGGFGNVTGDVCVNAPGATGNTHIGK